MIGANILLAYFHYCNKGLYPFSQECKDSDLQTLAELDDDSLDFVKRTRIYVEDYSRHNSSFVMNFAAAVVTILTAGRSRT